VLHHRWTSRQHNRHFTAAPRDHGIGEITCLAETDLERTRRGWSARQGPLRSCSSLWRGPNDSGRAPGFDALAATADAWLQTHDTLPGVVLHVRRFAGWENVGGVLRHVRFVCDHHRKVRRVALATDSALADLAPHVAEHFAHAELRRFGYDELNEAVAWASGRGDRRPVAAPVQVRAGSEVRV